MESVESILQFWFGDDLEMAGKHQAKLWWAKDAQVDAAMHQRFTPTLVAAQNGDCAAWLSSAQGRLAAILLFDQFPRNIYRDTPDAFAYDASALRLCKEGLALGQDKQLHAILRVFFYLPLEHSEALSDQEQAIAQYQGLLADLEPDQALAYAGYLDFAHRHHAVIARFGRFPHRNRILRRTSSAEELAFLAQPGSSF